MYLWSTENDNFDCTAEVEQPCSVTESTPIELMDFAGLVPSEFELHRVTYDFDGRAFIYRIGQSDAVFTVTSTYVCDRCGTIDGTGDGPDGACTCRDADDDLNYDRVA